MWPRKKRFGWVYAGVYCEEHLREVAKVLGTIKVESVDKEYIELNQKCSAHGCAEFVSFVVYKEGTPP